MSRDWWAPMPMYSDSPTFTPRTLIVSESASNENFYEREKVCHKMVLENVTYLDFDQNIESFDLVFYEACQRVLCYLSSASSVNEISNRHEVVQIPAVVCISLEFDFGSEQFVLKIYVL